MSNAQYTQVENTALNAPALVHSLNDAQQLSNTSRWISGSFTPTAAGNYPLLGADGNRILLAPRSFVVRSTIVGTTTPAIAGGTNADVGGAPADVAGATQAVVTSVTGGPVATAALLGGVTVTASATALGATNYFVNGTTTGTYTAGTVLVNLEVIDA